MDIKTVGSVCSGIEAASVAFKDFHWNFEWFSEIDKNPSKVLAYHYQNVQNVGDMNLLPKLILDEKISSPDLICGGTPCQAFSLSGLKRGLSDSRGNLTLKFVDIIKANDTIRQKKNLPKTIVFWENVEGVLKDKTNAFGCFLSALSGIDCLSTDKWKTAGYIHGKDRNVAWRVLDAKYFGIPQQRKRLYVLAGGTDFYPENILFEFSKELINSKIDYSENNLTYTIDNQKFEIFRSYTDCLYSSYGTKWNGNAAAYNGSLYIVQNDRLRRLTPIECERLMGFTDNYTMVDGLSNTARYKCIGNSWAIPVVKWIGEQLKDCQYDEKSKLDDIYVPDLFYQDNLIKQFDEKDNVRLSNGTYINISVSPNIRKIGDMKNIFDKSPDKALFISSTGCYGILRRKRERNLTINKRLEQILTSISNETDLSIIEKESRKQKRGKYST